MAPRFRVERQGSALVLPTVDAVLDAVEAGRLGASDVVFDAERNAFVRVQDHPELRAAWDERQRYKPLDDRRPLPASPDAALAFPALSDGGATPAQGVVSHADLEARKAAWRAIRDGSPAQAPRVGPAPDAQRHPAERGESVLTATALVLAVLLLGLVGWSVLAFATGMGGMLTAGVWGR
jgi:hypothetical protein